MKSQIKLYPMWQEIADNFNRKNRKKLKEFEEFEKNHYKMEAEECGFKEEKGK